jgi:hypothetical protein
MTGSRRCFANICRRNSIRYQARYRAPNGRLLSAPQIFARKSDAVRWLMLKEAEFHRGEWIDPDHADAVVQQVRLTDLDQASRDAQPW